MSRRRKIVFAVMVATMLFVLSVAPVYAQEPPIPPEDLTPLTAFITLAMLLLPLVSSLIKRFLADKPKELQSAVIFAVCVLVGLGQAYFNGSLKWANGDVHAIIALMVLNVTVVLILAYGWYKMFWQAVGIDAKISGQ